MSDSDGITGHIRERLKQGDTNALADEFSRQRERLWRMVHFRLDRKLAGRIDPDDVLQEAYLAAAQRITHFLEQEDLSVFVWLRLIVGQTMVDMQRRHLGAQMRDAFREIPMHNPAFSQSTSVSIAAQLLGSFTSPSYAAIRDETARQLEEAVESMDSIDREVLALRHFEELSNKEVAEVLGIQQKAASIRYVRAVRRLKDILSHLPGFGAESDND